MNYPYANGQVKALENKLLDRNKLTKLMKINKNDFLKTLIDLGYGYSNSKNIEEIINDELLNIKKLFDEISPQKKYTDLFFLAYDAINIKAFYKSKIFKVDNHDLFVQTGIIPKDILKLAIFEEDYSLLSKEYQKLLININDKVQELDNPRIISAIIDNSIFQFILQRSNNNDSLQTYFQGFIDFANVLTFIRSLRINWKFKDFSNMYLENGKISLDVYENLYELSNEAIMKGFNNYYNEKVTKGLRVYYDSKDLSLLERHFDKLLLELMSEFQHDSFGIGPIIYYYLKKQAEAKNIRLIYASNDVQINDLLIY